MTLIDSLAIITFAALIHASFQLSVSVLTLVSGHAIGRKAQHARILRLASGFTAGAGVMTMLLLASVAYGLAQLYGNRSPALLWAVVCGLLVGIGISVWRFYYRPDPAGTSLWIPRSMARYLHERSKATKRSAEAFGLGLSSVIAELLFVIAPLIITALVLTQLTPAWQLTGLILYTAISLLPLLIVGTLIGGGHKLSQIQKWRESNKNFLQFAAGSGLLVLGAYVYVEQVLTTTVSASGGPLIW